MTPQKQLYRHDPDNGVYGDCWRTAIACLLDLPPEDVPHMHVDSGVPNMAEQDRRMNEFLASRGLMLIGVPFPGEMTLETLLAAVEVYSSGTRALLTGKSRTGCNHIVVLHQGAIEWDPAQTDSGIIAPADDGYWWVNWLGARL